MAKLMISFLGTGKYETGQYGFSPEQKYTGRFVQTALAALLKPDRVIVMVTQAARARNWEGPDGLAATAARELSSMVFREQLIPEGKTEDEVVSITVEPDRKGLAVSNIAGLEIACFTIKHVSTPSR